MPVLQSVEATFDPVTQRVTAICCPTGSGPTPGMPEMAAAAAAEVSVEGQEKAQAGQRRPLNALQRHRTRGSQGLPT